jgi:hypothetical protein
MSIIRTRSDWVLYRLDKFYTANPDYTEKVRSILNGAHTVTLRLLEWFVTNYAKYHNVSYLVGSRHVVVYSAYKSHLDGYKKGLFDPFCRKDRIQYRDMTTTVAQLGFFEWAFHDGVMKYAEEHSADIRADMDARAPKTDDLKKRREVSRTPKTLKHYDVCVKVSFS